MKFSIITLGCKVNQFESAAMGELLRRAGHELADRDADAVIINTCSVTAESDRKSRQTIRRAEKDNPGAFIAVCGCSTQLSPDYAGRLGAGLVGGSADRKAFVARLLELMRDRSPAGGPDVDEAMKRRAFEPLPARAVEGRTRALLKVEDGCVNFCAYCVIPYARGPVRSLAAEDAAAQAVELRSMGFREIVLTGIELASWGADLPGKPGLAELLEKISAAVPDVRLRLGSLEPRIVTEDFARRAAALPNLADHFHLSLQSGCDATLARMKRKYDSSRFYRSVELLRERFPECGLTADLICGFPGETEGEFEETIKFIKKCNFSNMHIFPFSPRPGTPAASMQDALTNSVKKERCALASRTADEMRAGFLLAQVGKTRDVIFETGGTGHTGNYCVVGTADAPEPGTRALTFITGTDGSELTGKVLDRE